MLWSAFFDIDRFTVTQQKKKDLKHANFKDVHVLMKGFFFYCRVKEEESGNITMKETGSKPLRRHDLDSDVSGTCNLVNCSV